MDLVGLPGPPCGQLFVFWGPVRSGRQCETRGDCHGRPGHRPSGLRQVQGQMPALLGLSIRGASIRGMLPSWQGLLFYWLGGLLLLLSWVWHLLP